MIKFLSETSKVTWLDLTLPTSDELVMVSERFNLPYSYVHNCLDPEHMPSYMKINDVNIVSLRMVEDNHPDDAETIRKLTQKVVLFFGNNFIVSIHRRDHENFNHFCENLAEALHNPLPVAYLVDRLIMLVLRTYEEPVQAATEKIGEFEEKIFVKQENTLLIKDFFQLKRRLDIINRLLDAIKEVNQLIIELNPNDRWHESLNYNEKLLFRVRIHAESINSLLNLHLSLSAHRTNEVMRVLTVFSVLFMPLTFIVGIWGMNMKDMPLEDDEAGFTIICIIMALSTILSAVWFKRRGWIKY